MFSHGAQNVVLKVHVSLGSQSMAYSQGLLFIIYLVGVATLHRKKANPYIDCEEVRLPPPPEQKQLLHF